MKVAELITDERTKGSFEPGNKLNEPGNNFAKNVGPLGQFLSTLKSTVSIKQQRLVYFVLSDQTLIVWFCFLSNNKNY